MVKEASSTARKLSLTSCAASRGHRHLLHGPVVADRERLGDVVHHDRLGHQSSSGILLCNREKTTWATSNSTVAPARWAKPIANRWSGMFVWIVSAGWSVDPTQKARW